MMANMSVDWSKPVEKDGKFHNPSGTRPKGPSDLLKWVLFEKKIEWSHSVTNSHRPSLQRNLTAEKLNCVMVNHASILLQFPQGNVLTDPVFSQRTSPVKWAGPPRHQPPGLQLQELPHIHTVLISHNHYDHMDLDSLRFLWRKFDPEFVMPLRNSEILTRAGIRSSQFRELTWFETMTSKCGLQLSLTPAQHWSSRSAADRNRALWGGFWIDNSKHQIFFAGDTGFSNHFKQIQQLLGTPTLSFLPIGAYEPRWFMKDQHMNPEDAVKAHLDLQSLRSLGIHWGTWQLTNESMEDPVQALAIARQKFSLVDHQFEAFSNGQSILL